MGEVIKTRGWALFPPGQVFVTPNLTATLESCGVDAHQEIVSAIERHLHGDWGTVCEEDWQTNNAALRDGDRLLSAYETVKGHVSFWVITEWDRSVTTVLLPEDY